MKCGKASRPSNVVSEMFKAAGEVVKITSMEVRGKLYSACVRSCMIYGSETWALTVESQKRLDRVEMQMLRRICIATLKDMLCDEVIGKRVGVECVLDVIQWGRLRWFGHTERKLDEDWVKKCRSMSVDENTAKGRLNLTWMAVVKSDMKKLGMGPEVAQARNFWRRITLGYRKANLDLP